MLVLGILLLLGGAGSLIWGFMQNNNAEAQLRSLLSSGQMDPGTIFIIVGAVCAVLGLILTIIGATKKKS